MAQRKTKDLHVRVTDENASRYAQAMAILEDTTVHEYITKLICMDALKRGLAHVVAGTHLKADSVESSTDQVEVPEGPKGPMRL